MRLTRLLSSCLLLILLGLPGVAMALDFSAFWLYRTSGGEGRETRSELLERYTLGVGPQLDWRPTHAITASAGVGYNRSQQDTGSGTRESDEITPSARLTLNNDIFSLGLAGSASQRSGNDQETSTTNSWDATLASRWSIPFWPNVQFNYGQRDDGGDNQDLFSRSQRIQTSKSATVDWDLLLARLNYRYSESLDEDQSTGVDTESISHFAKIETDGRFFNNRISYNLSQQVQDTRSTTSGETDAEGFLPVTLDGTGFARAALESENPVDPGYVSPGSAPTLTIDPLLNPLDRFHVSFVKDSFLDPRIREVRLNFPDDQLDDADDLTWNLFGRNASTSTWDPVPLGIGLPGTRVNDGVVTIAVILDEDYDQILLTSSALGTTTLSLEGIDAWGQVAPDEEGEFNSRTRSYLTSAGLRVNLTRTLSLSTNATYELFERGEAENSRQTMSGRLRWAPVIWFSPSVSYSESLEENEGQDELLNRTYGITVATLPLPTLNVTFGANQNERFDGDIKTNESLRYTISSSAQIYPDLSASLFMTWQDAEIIDNRDELNEDETAEAEYNESATFSNRLNLNARLTQALVADLTVNYRESEREDETRETGDASLILQYRPSAFLALRGFYTTYLLDSLQDDSMGGGFSLALLRTSKTRLTMEYNVAYAQELSQRVGVNGSWNLSQALSVQTRTNYTFADTNFYSAQVSLNLRL